MSATTLEAPKTSPLPAGSQPLDAPGRRRVRVRPARHSGRGLAPQARPARPVAAPRFAPPVNPGVRACSAEPQAHLKQAPVTQPVRTRLTDRGIAVILVVGAMIVLAAVTVVSLTAVRVSSDNYQPLTSTSVLMP